MKYEHNEVHDKTVGEIVRGGYSKCDKMNPEPVCGKCPLGWNYCSSEGKRQCVIEYIAEEVADNFKKWRWKNSVFNWQEIMACDAKRFGDKYPVDEQTAKEIADMARVLLEGEKKIDDVLLDAVKFSATRSSLEAWQLENLQLKEDRPTTADAFYVYNSDLEKCVTVSREQGDDIIDIAIHNEMDIETARVFCEKLALFLGGI